MSHNSIACAYSSKVHVQTFRTQSKYESALAMFHLFDPATVSSIELPGLASFLSEMDLPHQLLGLLELRLCHQDLMSYSRVLGFPRLQKGAKTKHLKGAIGGTKKFIKAYPNAHDKAQFAMAACFKSDMPVLDDPIEVAFCERYVQLRTAAADVKTGQRVAGKSYCR
eukprot:1365663-Amphidinium_carterae.1